MAVAMRSKQNKQLQQQQPQQQQHTEVTNVALFAAKPASTNESHNNRLPTNTHAHFLTS